jgi:hypothetical protein
MSADVFSVEKVDSLLFLIKGEFPLSIKILTKAVNWLIGWDSSEE